MTAKRMLCVLGCLTLGAVSAAPVQKEKPMIKCELKITGKIGEHSVSDGGEMAITNVSAEIIDIGTDTAGPQSNFDFKVTDPNGKAIELEPLEMKYPSFRPGVEPHPLKPGETFRCQEQLLTRISEEKRISGTYKVKAVFTLQGKSYESAAVDVKCVKEKPTIKCELKFTGKVGENAFADGGEVVIANTSKETIDIGTDIGPLGLVQLKAKDPKGQYLKTVPLAYNASAVDRVVPHPLKPGESHRGPVLLLPAVPEDKRLTGTYKVKVVLTYQRKEYESAEVDVKWPAEKK